MVNNRIGVFKNSPETPVELLDHLPEALLLVNSDGEVQWLNRAAEELAALPLAGNRVDTGLTAPSLLRSLPAEIDVELELVDTDGQHRIFDVSCWPLADAQDKGNYTVIALRDGSGRRQASQLAHTANNALGAARGQCEITKIKSPGNADIESRMKTAIESIDEVAKLLRQTVRIGLPHPAETARNANDWSIARLLLLTGDPTLRDATAELLRMQGYEVLAVADADGLLQKIYDELRPVDVLLCELSAIPPRLLEQLHRTQPELRYLFLSDDLESPQVGRCAYLAKPFSAEALEAKLEQLLAD